MVRKNIKVIGGWHLHDHKRSLPSVCSSGGYPLIRQGSRGVYVLIAQDDLNTLGFRTGGLDGVFGSQTKNAVINYQRSIGLTEDGIVVCNTWLSLWEDVVGRGRIRTTID